ncbi:LutC/YkgG family protein [Granulosicoccus antarcticus]|uniref:Lactate utilization protein C n=1 Tax=Granulosicoccus antarcticus IMCC3135 TaxID=1192854 RepID=A0A2Z2NMC4_9GAMM|nr:LUD domain-containing protein [Granulosicoccus antarcticus]ASJ72592.1 Lactate utilization protein C [Granulosicoccus antarcticus IMCC3135]
MSDRSAILGAIRAATRACEVPASQIASEAATLVAEATVVQPKFGGVSLVERFVSKASSERVTATVSRVDTMAEVPASVADYLNQRDQRMQLAVQPTVKLEQLDWAGFERLDDLADDGGVAVTLAEYGIAETGSVVFRSAADAPVLLTFLPLIHIVVLQASTILAYPEDLWSHLGGADAPQSRALTLVTGTSGTADIEAINVRGAHGPRSMHIVLVTE